MLASLTACEWSAKWLREQCFIGAPSAVHCVFLIMGSPLAFTSQSSSPSLPCPSPHGNPQP